MEHNFAYELIEEYVFGTLSQPDHDAVQLHLDSGCEICQARVGEVEEASVHLAEGLVEQTPSGSLRANILTQVGSNVAETTKRKKPTQLYAWTVATIGIAASFVLLVWVNSLRQELSDTRTELEASRVQIARLVQDNSVQTDATYLLGLPCTKTVDLAGVTPNENSFAKIVIHPDEDFAVAYLYRLPPTPEGKEYQLWVEIDGQPISVGVFNIEENGEALVKMQSIPKPTSIASFKVTIEPTGGLSQPSGMLYLTGANSLTKMQSH